MKVVCVTAGDATGGDGWLSVHREYNVLEIVAIPNAHVNFRVIANNGTPILVPSRLFVASNQALPPSWAASVTEDGVLTISPPAWLVEGFWDRFFDGDADAIAVFERELAELGREEAEGRDIVAPGE